MVKVGKIQDFDREHFAFIPEISLPRSSTLVSSSTEREIIYLNEKSIFDMSFPSTDR